MVKQDRKVLGRGLRALISPAHVPLDGGGVAVDAMVDIPSVANPPLVEESLLVSKDDVVMTELPDSTMGEISQAGQGSKDADSVVVFLATSELIANPDQPRKHFSREDLDDLVESIERVGVLQPIVARLKFGQYEIVAGERRWRAAQEAGLERVPVIVKDLDDSEAFQLSLIENIQRQQLNPIEEARGYQRLIEEFGLTQEQVSEMVGKKRASIANLLRLLNLDDEVLGFVETEELSQGHAKVILGVKDKLAQKRLARRIIQEGLSVRAVEKILPSMVVLDRGKAVKHSLEPLASEFDAKLDANPELLDRLRAASGTRVSIKQSGRGKGRIILEFFSEDELGRLVDLICSQKEFVF